MWTKLEYIVYTDDNNKRISRNAAYTFTGESEEVKNNINKFEDILRSKGYKLQGCPTDETANEKRQYTDFVVIWNKEEFEKVKKLLKEFKVNLKIR